MFFLAIIITGSLFEKFYLLPLQGCNSLLSLPEDVGVLSTLQFLDLTSCFSLVVLPDSISRLTGLRSLRTNHCTGVLSQPDGLSNLTLLPRSDQMEAMLWGAYPRIAAEVYEEYGQFYSRRPRYCD